MDIVVAEALDEMGVKPVAIAGTSIGAIIGASVMLIAAVVALLLSL